MVTINATIIVELVLFLLFLWGTQRYILAPVLKNIDEREDSIEQDRAQAEANTTAAFGCASGSRTHTGNGRFHEVANVIRRNTAFRACALHSG